MKDGKPRYQISRWILVLVALSGASTVAAGAGGRIVVSLDGRWSFRLDPGDAGKAKRWFDASAALPDGIEVPGAWQAQGYGTESDKLRHNYEGKAWYRRQVPIPAEWKGKRLFLCIGGVHRYAEVWVNGVFLGEHIGYLSPFEFEITKHARPAATATIAICVDCKQRWDIDCLTGCFDIIDEMFTVWGGIWGHVTLEARGAAWLEDVFVQPEISPAGCSVTARVAGDREKADAVLLEVLSKDGAAAGREQRPLATATMSDATLQVSVPVANARLWSPDSPNLYTARLSLLRVGEVIDRVESRFGLRRIELRGASIFLNGRKIFLHGYGDDSVYPKTMAAPSDKAFYLERLKAAKACGFNYVRHHSAILPPEYYDAQDEMGILVSAEFPIAYMPYYEKAKGPALDLYKQEWAAAIRRLRNHPSIFNWCMGNELWGSIPLAPELYKTAKTLDPTRPVIDSDGLGVPPFVRGPGDRDTLDFFQALFDEWSLPLDSPGKHAFDRPLKPVLSHETGNYTTFPRMSLIDEFKHNFKPFWLNPAKAKLEKLGLLAEAGQWSENSERLYLLAHKLNIEDLRKNPHMSGYTWWLIQDYWTGSNGIVDTYFRPKHIDLQAIRQFNADRVLLQDGLEVTYRSPGPVKLRLLMSNYGPESIRGGLLRWQVRLGDRVFSEKEATSLDVAQGEVKALTEVQVDLPSAAAPTRLTVTAELKAGKETCRNDWQAWVYPEQAGRLTPGVPLHAGSELAPALTRFGAKPLVRRVSKEDPPAVYVVNQLTASLLQAAEAGSCIVCLSTQGAFPSTRNRFKPSWWIGGPWDSNTGTVVYDHVVTRAMAPDGWCDAGWYRLLEGADACILDDFPAAPAVIVRGLDVHRQEGKFDLPLCRSKALLFETRVGRGSLIVCGLNLIGRLDQKAPEAEWLLTRLLEYAATMPKPKAELPTAFLQERLKAAPSPEGPFLPGFAKLIKNEGEETSYESYRGTPAPLYICRQTLPGHTVEWETAPVPADWPAGDVTFVFAGALGWKTQPKTEGFDLLVNGKEALVFDLANQYQVWRSTDGKTTLYFLLKRDTREDAMGLFYLTVPADVVSRGQPLRLGVRSKGKDSRRWFGLNPYTDIVVPPG